MRDPKESTDLFVFGRLHAREGQEAGVAAALTEVAIPTRNERGCIAVHGYRSNRDPRTFYIHSRWVDEAAFDLHGDMPYTLRFVERVTALIDHPLEVTRTRSIG
jgi:quinol monooxygenase YgiN